MSKVDEKESLSKDLAHLSRLALAGREQDVQLYVRRMARRYRDSIPQLADDLGELLRKAPTRGSPLREAPSPVPVDLDSRLQLLRTEHIARLDVEPIFPERVRRLLLQVVSERRDEAALEKDGLSPTRSILFTGPPGVGKTLAARWLARELALPLLTLDLSAVMSSFLGRTGNNVRYVLDYAKSTPSILLLDEFDAIAKRRDDATEVGELKRLVTVLLQEVDDWPHHNLLIAATNHPDLLDQAVWRRFELVIEFPMPDELATRQAVTLFLHAQPAPWPDILATALRGASFSEIERAILQARRAAAAGKGPIEPHLQELVQSRIATLSKAAKTHIAAELVASNRISQRQAYEITGISRDTIRKALRSNGEATDAQ